MTVMQRGRLRISVEGLLPMTTRHPSWRLTRLTRDVFSNPTFLKLKERKMLTDLHACTTICWRRVVNNTGKKYCNIQYQYQAKKVDFSIAILTTLSEYTTHACTTICTTGRQNVCQHGSCMIDWPTLNGRKVLYAWLRQWDDYWVVVYLPALWIFCITLYLPSWKLSHRLLLPSETLTPILFFFCTF